MKVYLLFGSADDFTDVIGVFGNKPDAEKAKAEFDKVEYTMGVDSSHIWIEEREVQ